MFLVSCSLNLSLNIFSHNKWLINEADNDDSFRANVNPIVDVLPKPSPELLNLWS